MVSRAIFQIFEQYQKSRLIFAQSVAELALRPQNNEILRKEGILGKFRKFQNITAGHQFCFVTTTVKKNNICATSLAYIFFMYMSIPIYHSGFDKINIK